MKAVDAGSTGVLALEIEVSADDLEFSSSRSNEDLDAF
jgi:hypothetical protein